MLIKICRVTVVAQRVTVVAQRVTVVAQWAKAPGIHYYVAGSIPAVTPRYCTKKIEKCSLEHQKKTKEKKNKNMFCIDFLMHNWHTLIPLSADTVYVLYCTQHYTEQFFLPATSGGKGRESVSKDKEWGLPLSS
jgi:hypothetical protein